MPPTTPDPAVYPIPMSHEDMLSTSPFIGAVASLGLPMIALNPRTEPDPARRKAPRDLRTSAEKDADEAAGVHGGGWRIGTTDPAVWDRWMAAWRTRPYADAPLNVAVVPGPSSTYGGILIIDVDTSEQLASLAALWQRWTGEELPPLTVQSPGVREDADGKWVHKGGGHLYVSYAGTLPEGVPAHVTLDGGVLLKLHSGYVAAPPSVRAEGPYMWGPGGPAPVPAPPALRALIRASVPTSTSSRGEWVESDVDVEWDQNCDWATILVPAGFEPTTLTDQCGCPIWHRIGGGSQRSATAHRTGCQRWTGRTAPLHLWSDGDYGPIGTWARERRVTSIPKLVAFALVFHGGDVRAAKRSEGLYGAGSRRARQMVVRDGTLTEAPTAATPLPQWSPTAPVEKVMIPTGPAVLVGAVIPLAEQTEDDEHGYVEPEAPVPFGLRLIHRAPAEDPSGDPRVWHVPVYPSVA